MSVSPKLKYYLLVISLVCIGIGAGLHIFTNDTEHDIDLYKSTIERNINERIADLQRDVVDILEYLESGEPIDFTGLNNKVEHSFYVFNGERLTFWSDYHYVPEYRFLTGDYRIKFVRTIRKDFLVRKWTIANTNIEVYGIVPLYDNFKVDNDYIESGFNPDIFPDQSLSILQRSEGVPICLQGEEGCYFNVEFDNSYVQNRVVLDRVITVFITLGIIFFGLFAYLIARFKALASVEIGFLYLLVALMSMRFIMLFYNFPRTHVQSDLFDSRFFASSAINPSLGDLFLNILMALILVIFLFSQYTRVSTREHLMTVKGWWGKAISVILAGTLPLLLQMEFLTFQTIYHNSQLTFDINQTIKFDLNRSIGFGVFLLLSCAIFLAHHVVYKFFKKRNARKRNFFSSLAMGMGLFAAVNLLIGQAFLEALVISLCWVLVLHTTGLSGFLTRIRYNTFLYFFSGIIAVAAVGALAIYAFENEREFERKQKFATQFLIENDNLAEFLLSEINQNIKNDVFIQSRMASPFLSKDIINSKIRQVYLSNYFDKYDLKIYLYNSNGQPFNSNQGSLSPAEIKKFDVEQYRTSYDGIYYINKLGGEVAKRYLDFIEVKKRGISVGYIILDLNLKRIIPENVYPELLVDNRFLFPYQDVNYSYAIFSGEEILYNSGGFNYNTDFNHEWLTSNRIYNGGLKKEEYSHLAVKDPEGKVVVISSNQHPTFDIISNFSFLFLVQVFALLLLTALYTLYFSFQKTSLNYSARIQLYLNVAFFMPLFAVSITTLSLINSSFKKEVNEEYHRKARSISTNVSEDLNNYVKDVIADREELPNKLSQVAKFSGVDVNLFNMRGRLISTSQPLIYENNLLSRHINPEAFAKIKEQGENAYICRESVGGLAYNTTFYGVKSFESGDLIGILSIPFFQSEYALEQNQIEVLSNIINIFTIIFIIFLLVSYLAAQWLTFPLTFITQKLKKTTLTGFNEPLTWKSDDEIGLMVGEYNRMLVNLEESKKALARSEKESAWREIAQQVAHEIKNPLTPMKLTLQHLSRKLKGTPDNKELERPINTLLNEIETLNDIASSFSSFAKMPMPENERYEVKAVLTKSVNLHRARKDVGISLQMPDHEVYTMGDEQLMGRIISNILLNAIQSVESQSLALKISLEEISKHRFLLEINDNGPGIDESIQNKIFMPNFSTKETGSGIGLAIAKHGVEHAGGKIWFETEKDKGTSFFIELPLVD